MLKQRSCIPQTYSAYNDLIPVTHTSILIFLQSDYVTDGEFPISPLLGSCESDLVVLETGDIPKQISICVPGTKSFLVRYFVCTLVLLWIV